jgi:hypothetical protein
MVGRRWKFSRWISRLLMVLYVVPIVATVSIMPASASSGGGCAGGYGYEFGGAWGCISASGSDVLPDGYVVWNGIPPGCSVALELVNSSGNVVARGNYGCGAYHYGPLRVHEPSGTTWHSYLYVYSNYGTSLADSPAQYLSY